MRKLEDLDSNEFEFLKKSGMLWEFYPEAPLFWELIGEEESDDYFPPSEGDDYDLRDMGDR